MADTEIDRKARALTFTGAAPHKRRDAEDWVMSLGVTLVPVAFLCADGAWVVEQHVDDELTISETIGMMLDRSRATYALRAYHGRWELTRRGHGVRYYDTKEAAEMVAIHNG